KVPKVEKETSVFDGIDTSLAGILSVYGKDEKTVSEYTKKQIETIRQSAKRALGEYNPAEPQKIVPILAEGYKAVHELISSYMVFSGTEERRRRFTERVAAEREIRSVAWAKLGEFTEA